MCEPLHGLVRLHIAFAEESSIANSGQTERSRYEINDIRSDRLHE
jgi:hypothetical protein